MVGLPTSSQDDRRAAAQQDKRGSKPPSGFHPSGSYGIGYPWVGSVSRTSRACAIIGTREAKALNSKRKVCIAYFAVEDFSRAPAIAQAAFWLEIVVTLLYLVAAVEINRQYSRSLAELMGIEK